MKLVVTGGAGFIGSHLVRSTLAGSYPAFADADVHVLDLLTYAGTRTNLPTDDPRLTFVHGDIRDLDIVYEVLAGADLVVHLAAESHVDRSIHSAADFVSTNVLGTQVLLQAALDTGVSRFVHVSTDEVYGSIEHGSWPETRPLWPNSPYSASKASSDLLARAYFRTHGLPVCVTRCSNNYGPHQFPEKIIPLFVTNLLDGRKVPLYGDGLNVRDWLHVDDHCRGIVLAAEKGRDGEVYNIGGGTELTNRELTERLVRAVGADESMIERVADRLGHDRRYSVDCSKIADELGAAGAVRAGAGRHRGLVRRTARLVGAAQEPVTAQPRRAAISRPPPRAVTTPGPPRTAGSGAVVALAKGIDHAPQDPERARPLGLGQPGQHPDLDRPDRHGRLLQTAPATRREPRG